MDKVCKLSRSPWLLTNRREYRVSRVDVAAARVQNYYHQDVKLAARAPGGAILRERAVDDQGSRDLKKPLAGGLSSEHCFSLVIDFRVFKSAIASRCCCMHKWNVRKSALSEKRRSESILLATGESVVQQGDMITIRGRKHLCKKLKNAHARLRRWSGEIARRPAP